MSRLHGSGLVIQSRQTPRPRDGQRAIEQGVLRYIEQHLGIDGNFCQSQQQVGDALDLDRRRVGEVIDTLEEQKEIRVVFRPPKGSKKSLIVRPLRHEAQQVQDACSSCRVGMRNDPETTQSTA